MALSQTSVLKLYNTVIDDVIAGVRDAFLDEGVDEQVLQEMKQVWTAKLMASKAVETTPDPSDQPPSILANSTKSVSSSKANGTKKAKAAAAAAAAAANQENQNGTTKSNSAASAAAPAIVKPEPVAEPPQTLPVQQQQQQQQQQQLQPPPLAQAQPTLPQPAAVQPPPAQQPAPPAAVVAALDPNKMVAIQITLPALPNVPNSQPRVLTIQVPASALQENQLQQVLTGPIITSIMPLPPQIASSVLQQHVNSYLQNNTINTIQIHKQMDGAYDMPMDTTDADEHQLPMFALSEVLDQHSLVKLAHNGTIVPQNVSAPSTSSSSSCTAAAASRRKKVANRRRVMIEIRHQLDGAVDTSDEEASDISDDNIGDDDEDDLDKEDDEDLDGEGGAEEEPLNSEDDVTDEDASDLFDTDNVVVCQYDKITRSRNKWKFYLKDGIMNITGKDYVFQKSNGDAEW